MIRIGGIIKDLLKRGYSGTYYLQSFVYTGDTIGKAIKEQKVFDRGKVSQAIKVVWRG